MQHPLHIFHFCPRCGSGRFDVNNAKSKRCADCGFVYYFNPSAAVACFVTDPQGNVLVSVRAHEPAAGTWDLPGGFVDSFETAEEAARRELKEETGLDAGNIKYLFSIPNIYPYSGFEVHTLDIFLEVEVESFDGMEAADDVSQLIICKKEDLLPGRFGLSSVRKAVEKFRTT